MYTHAQPAFISCTLVGRRTKSPTRLYADSRSATWTMKSRPIVVVDAGSREAAVKERRAEGRRNSSSTSWWTTYRNYCRCCCRWSRYCCCCCSNNRRGEGARRKRKNRGKNRERIYNTRRRTGNSGVPRSIGEGTRLWKSRGVTEWLRMREGVRHIDRRRDDASDGARGACSRRGYDDATAAGCFGNPGKAERAYPRFIRVCVGVRAYTRCYASF